MGGNPLICDVSGEFEGFGTFDWEWAGL